MMSLLRDRTRSLLSFGHEMIANSECPSKHSAIWDYRGRGLEESTKILLSYAGTEEIRITLPPVIGGSTGCYFLKVGADYAMDNIRKALWYIERVTSISLRVRL